MLSELGFLMMNRLKIAVFSLVVFHGVSCSSGPVNYCDCVEYILPMIEENVENFEQWKGDYMGTNFSPLDDPNLKNCRAIMARKGDLSTAEIAACPKGEEFNQVQFKLDSLLDVESGIVPVE